MYTQTVTADFRSLAIDQLKESPTNPRRSFDPAKLQELAQSIRAQGILVPIIVRPTATEFFEVVAGARRFRAAQMADLFAVPVRVVGLTDAEALTLQLVENAIREDVHPYEEAMAYRALLEASEPRYDVASLALKTGRSVNHIYGRLRMAELIPEAAEVFQANQITAGHAVLIARLPQEQQYEALEAAFREDWRTREKHAISVRELAQWIRDNLMLSLADAAFDRADAELVPGIGPCVTCSKRTGANAALFDDFPQDDKCLDGQCFRSKLDAHLVREQKNKALVQITRGDCGGSDSGETALPQQHHTEIEPPERRYAEPVGEAHAAPARTAEDERADRAREQERARWEEERLQNRESNRQLLDSVLTRIPPTLTRDDYQMLVFAAIERLEYEDWAALAERHDIKTDDSREPDAAEMALYKKAEEATELQLVRMLIELGLLRSGYSDEKLDPTDPLIRAAARYAKAKRQHAKCAGRKTPSRRNTAKASAKKSIRKGGAV
ncbi:MAG TPA: ParB/RepB/Spo0J family partition protein [Bryobacteraceae bacterium]|nr:ParB/RepB/Spo0J family partition protein [Bryobacteraceae bacterium]